jgi:hypothetical protein
MLARSRSAAVLLASIALLPTGSARAAIGYVGTIGTASSATVGTTLSVAVPAGGVAAGDSIIVVFTMPDLGPPVTATDSQGNVYAADADAVASGSVHTVVFSARNVRALAAGDTITVTHPASSPASPGSTARRPAVAPAPLSRRPRHCRPSCPKSS